MKFQLVLYVFALVLVPTMYVVAQHVKICEPKSVFMDDCNRCRCSDDGFDKSCTRIMCVKKPGSEAGKTRTRRDYEGDLTCFPGEKFNISCHRCVCTEAGTKATAICTLEECFEGLNWQTDVEPDESKYCLPDSIFDNGCGYCYCPISGLLEEAICPTEDCSDQGVANFI